MMVNQLGWNSQAKTDEKQRRSKDELFQTMEEYPKEKRMKLAVWGEAGIGKTFALCSAPPPVYVLETEFGIAQLYKHFADKLKDIHVLHCAVSDGANVEEDAVRSLELVEEALDSLKDLEEGTLAIDSGSDLWQWVQVKMKVEVLKLGPAERIAPSDYAWGNMYYKKLMLKAKAINTHFVFTGHSQEKFGDARLTPTGVYVPRWQKWTPQYVDAVVWLRKPVGAEAKEGIVNQGVITKCRFMHMYGKKYDNFTFDMLYEDVEEYL